MQMIRVLILVSAATLGGCAVATEDGKDTREVTPPPAEPFSVSGTVSAHEIDADLPLDAANVCVEDRTGFHCESSGADGMFTIGSLANDSPRTLVVSKAGYVSVMTELPNVVPALHWNLGTISTATASTIAAAGGRPYAPGETIGVVFQTYAVGFDRLDPLAGVAIDVNGEPAVYGAAPELAEGSPRATTSSGWAAALGFASTHPDVGFASTHLDVSVRYVAAPGVACGLYSADGVKLDHFDLDLISGTVYSATIVCAPNTPSAE